jgi:hypothetical protein
MREKWVVKSGTGTGTSTTSGSPAMTPGALAYWNRKKAVWEELAKKADSIFRYSNSAYQSPL